MPLNWSNVPQVDWFTVVQQIQGMRDYLDSELFLFQSPIWVTQFGSLWGYDAWEVGQNGGLQPPPNLDRIADYQWEAMSGFMDSILHWLLINGESLRIEKWFMYRDYVDLTASPLDSDSLASPFLFDSPEVAAGLTPVGVAYRDRIVAQGE
jgi:hypothetical protein